MEPLRRGVYEAEVNLSYSMFRTQLTRAELIGLVSDVRFNAMTLNLEVREGTAALALPELMEACHERFEQNLRVLRRPATRAELEAANERLSGVSAPHDVWSGRAGHVHRAEPRAVSERARGAHRLPRAGPQDVMGDDADLVPLARRLLMVTPSSCHCRQDFPEVTAKDIHNLDVYFQSR